MTRAYQCPTCGDVTEDGACLCGPPAPTVARVPLRASVALLVVEVHASLARLCRDAAHTARRNAGRLSGLDPEGAAFWRETYAQSAAESEARADRHEAIAALWSGRVVR